MMSAGEKRLSLAERPGWAQTGRLYQRLRLLLQVTMRRELDRPERRIRSGLGRPLEIEDPHSQVGQNGRWPSLLHRRPERTEAKLCAQKIQIAELRR